jgi:hypothetical protein
VQDAAGERRLRGAYGDRPRDALPLPFGSRHRHALSASAVPHAPFRPSVRGSPARRRPALPRLHGRPASGEPSASAEPRPPLTRGGARPDDAPPACFRERARRPPRRRTQRPAAAPHPAQRARAGDGVRGPPPDSRRGPRHRHRTRREDVATSREAPHGHGVRAPAQHGMPTGLRTDAASLPALAAAALQRLLSPLKASVDAA